MLQFKVVFLKIFRIHNMETVGKSCSVFYFHSFAVLVVISRLLEVCRFNG